VVHGDYRLDNMIFHRPSRVKAVLDWELSTLGDPMADFTYLLMQWTMPGLGGADLKAEHPEHGRGRTDYCNIAGTGVPDLNWYFSYICSASRHHPRHRRRSATATAANAKAMEISQAHRAAGEGVMGIRAEGRRGVTRTGRDLAKIATFLYGGCVACADLRDLKVAP